MSINLINVDMKTQSFPLDTRVNTEKFDIINSGDEIRFSKKNTHLYKGTLSNLRSTSGTGIPSTTGRSLAVSGTCGAVSVDSLNTISASYVLNNSTKITKKNVINRQCDSNYVFTAYKESGNYYLEVADWKANVIDTYSFGTKPIALANNVPHYIVVQDALSFSSNIATLTYSIYSITVVSSVITLTAIFTYRQDELGKNYSDATYTADYDFCYGGEINNFYYSSTSNYVIGSDKDSQLTSWSIVCKSGTRYYFPYMGCVDNKGNVTGEPFPINGSYITWSGTSITAATALSNTPTISEFCSFEGRRKYAFVQDNASIRWLNTPRTASAPTIASMSEEGYYYDNTGTYTSYYTQIQPTGSYDVEGATSSSDLFDVTTYPDAEEPDGLYPTTTQNRICNRTGGYRTMNPLVMNVVGNTTVSAYTNYWKYQRYGWCYGFNFTNNEVAVRLIKPEIDFQYAASTNSLYCTHNCIMEVINDLDFTPGRTTLDNAFYQWNKTSDDYSYAFGSCVFTNIATNRGKTFTYGHGFSKTYWQARAYITSQYNSGAGTDSTTYYHYTHDYMTSIPKLVEYDFYNDTNNITPLDFTGKTCTDYRIANRYTNYQMAANEGNNCIISNSNYEDDDIIPTSYTAINGDKQGTVGDITNSILDKYWQKNSISADALSSTYETSWPETFQNLQLDYITDLPYCQMYGNVAVNYYSGLPLAASFNHCLLGAANEESKVPLYFYSTGSYTYICFDDMCYRVLATTSSASASDYITISKLNDYCFVTNILDTYNVIRESRDGDLEWTRGYIPYANEHYINKDLMKQFAGYLPLAGSSTNDIWYSAAGINPNLLDESIACSFLLPNITAYMYINSDDLQSFDYTSVNNANPVLLPQLDNLSDEDELDVYYTHSLDSTDITYKYTVNSDNEKSFTDNLQDNTWWITSSVIIYALGCGAVSSVNNYLTPTISLNGNYTVRLYQSNNTTFLGYNIVTATYYGSSIFTIYGSNYSYDKQAIYYIGGSNANVSNEFVCYILGLQFLANSGTEAYFYSPFDKCIYIFTGSNTLQQSTYLSILGTPIDAVFSTIDQSLYILTDASELYVVTPTSSWLQNIDGSALYTTTEGVAITDNDSWTIFNYDEGTVEPIEIETAPFGDYSTLFNFGIQDIILYDENSSNITVTLTFKSYNDNKLNVETKTINIKPNEWKDNHYRIRMNPKNPVGTYFQLGISSDDLIHVVYIGSTFGKTGEPSAPVRR